MRYIAAVLTSVSAAVLLAACGTGSVEMRIGMLAGDSPDAGPLLDVVELPEGHPPVLPPGHPPVLPPGHPPVPGSDMACPGSDLNRGWRPEHGVGAAGDAPAVIST